MLFMPFHILGIWFRGLLSVAILAGGIYLLSRWYDDSRATEVIQEPVAMVRGDAVPRADVRPVATEITAPTRRIFRFDPGWNKPTLELAAALALLTWATLGRLIGNGFDLMFLRPGEKAGTALRTPESKKGRRREAEPGTAKQTSLEKDIDPGDERTGTVHTIKRPDGSQLRVECYGPSDALPIVWTHGWGAEQHRMVLSKTVSHGSIPAHRLGYPRHGPVEEARQQ